MNYTNLIRNCVINQNSGKVTLQEINELFRIGLGKTKELVPEMNKSNFTKVDITTFYKLPIMKDKVIILSSHPKTSYHLTGEKLSDSLIITNPKEFWSLSKVLVVNYK